MTSEIIGFQILWTVFFFRLKETVRRTFFFNLKTEYRGNVDLSVIRLILKQIC